MLHLVTGGAGFIGSNLVRALVRQGHQVRVVDDLSTGFWEHLGELRNHPDVEPLTGDIRDQSLMARASEGVSVVFHEAALGSVPLSIEDPVRADSVNVHGTVTVLESARRAGVKRVVFAASSAAYGDEPTLPKLEHMPTAPLSPYAVSKIAAEQYLRVFAELYGIDTVCLRYFNVFGPNQRPDGAYAAAIPKFLWAALHDEPISIYGDGGATRDFCFIDNVVQANLAAAQSERKLGGEIVNVATGQSVTLTELVDEIATLLGKRLDVRHDPPRAGDIRHSVADIGRARELFGYEPTVAWREGLRPTADYLRELSRERGRS